MWRDSAFRDRTSYQIGMTTPPRSTTKKSSDSTKAVRVWSEVGVTVCITDDPPQYLKFTFGHERLAKSGSQVELQKTARQIDEFNEAEIEKRIDQYTRLIKAHEIEVGETDPEPREGSVKQRIRKRLEEEDDD